MRLHPTNNMRARRALKAINFYRKLTGQGRTTGGPKMEESLIDFLADIRHLAHLKGINWGPIEFNSKNHFDCEVHGQED